jgi:hypothetical protein
MVLTPDPVSALVYGVFGKTIVKTTQHLIIVFIICHVSDYRKGLTDIIYELNVERDLGKNGTL